MLLAVAAVTLFLCPTVEESESCKKTTAENGCDNKPAPRLPIPTIRIEMSGGESVEEPVSCCEPVKLKRVDRPLLRTPKVAGTGNMMLLIQPENCIVFGSPKVTKRRPVERTLSADSCRSYLRAADAHSPAASVKSSRASSADGSRLSSASRRSVEFDYLDDFDESSDVDEGQ